MPEFFLYSASFAAPFFSDSDTSYIEAESPEEALEKLAREYKHPAHLYAAACYKSADDYHKGHRPLAKWLSNHEQEKIKATQGRSYTYYGNGPGDFEIDGKRFTVSDPYGGSVVKE